MDFINKPRGSEISMGRSIFILWHIFFSGKLRAKVSLSFLHPSHCLTVSCLVLSHISLPGSSCSIVLSPLGSVKTAASEPDRRGTRSSRVNDADREMRKMDRDDDGELLLGEEGH